MRKSSLFPLGSFQIFTEISENPFDSIHLFPTEPKKSNFIRLARVAIDFWIFFCSSRVLSKLFFFSFDSSNVQSKSKRRLEKFDNFESTRDLCSSTTFKRVRKKRSNHQTHAPFTSSSSSSSVSTTATHVYWWS